MRWPDPVTLLSRRSLNSRPRPRLRPPYLFEIGRSVATSLPAPPAPPRPFPRPPSMCLALRLRPPPHKSSFRMWGGGLAFCASPRLSYATPAPAAFWSARVHSLRSRRRRLLVQPCGERGPASQQYLWLRLPVQQRRHIPEAGHARCAVDPLAAARGRRLSLGPGTLPPAALAAVASVVASGVASGVDSGVWMAVCIAARGWRCASRFA